MIESYYRKNYKRLVNQLCKRKGLSRDAAEDAVQEAFLNAHKYYHNFDEEQGEINSWFNTILRNTLVDNYNKSKDDCEECLDKAINLSDTFECRGGSLSPEDTAIVAESLKRVVNPRHRKIAEMFYITGYTTSEIASMGRSGSVTNVTTVLTRVREKLSGVEE